MFWPIQVVVYISLGTSRNLIRFLMQIADKTKSSLVSEGPLVQDSPGPKCCVLKEDTLFVRLRTGSTQEFMKRPNMTERVLTDA